MDGLRYAEHSLLGLDRSSVAEGRMQPASVVEFLHAREQVALGLVAGHIGSVARPLGLERVEKLSIGALSSGLARRLMDGVTPALLSAAW